MRKELYKFPPIFSPGFFCLAYVTEVCLLPKAASPHPAEEPPSIPHAGVPGIPRPRCLREPGRAGRVRGRTGSGAPHPRTAPRPGCTHSAELVPFTADPSGAGFSWIGPGFFFGIFARTRRSGERTERPRPHFGEVRATS